METSNRDPPTIQKLHDLKLILEWKNLFRELCSPISTVTESIVSESLHTGNKEYYKGFSDNVVCHGAYKLPYIALKPAFQNYGKFDT